MSLADITLLSLLATFLNPYGYKLHVHVYQYLTNRFLMNHIEEFRLRIFTAWRRSALLSC